MVLREVQRVLDGPLIEECSVQLSIDLESLVRPSLSQQHLILSPMKSGKSKLLIDIYNIIPEGISVYSFFCLQSFASRNTIESRAYNDKYLEASHIDSIFEIIPDDGLPKMILIDEAHSLLLDIGKLKEVYSFLNSLKGSHTVIYSSINSLYSGEAVLGCLDPERLVSEFPDMLIHMSEPDIERYFKTFHGMDQYRGLFKPLKHNKRCDTCISIRDVNFHILHNIEDNNKGNVFDIASGGKYSTVCESCFRKLLMNVN